MGRDRTIWHLNLNFQVTCDWQPSQFLRCFFLFGSSLYYERDYSARLQSLTNHCCDSLHFDSEDMHEDNFTKSWLKVFLIWVDLSTMMEKLFPKMPKLPTTTWGKQTREEKLWGKQTIAIKRSSSWSTYYSSLYSNKWSYEWSTCFWSNHSASIDHFHSLMDEWEVIGTSCPVLK